MGARTCQTGAHGVDSEPVERPGHSHARRRGSTESGGDAAKWRHGRVRIRRHGAPASRQQPCTWPRNWSPPQCVVVGRPEEPRWRRTRIASRGRMLGSGWKGGEGWGMVGGARGAHAWGARVTRAAVGLGLEGPGAMAWGTALAIGEGERYAAWHWHPPGRCVIHAR